MRVALVAGPEAGHALPALALAREFAQAGDNPVVFTGRKWQDAAATAGLAVRELPGLAPRDDEDDGDAGAKLSARAARMAVELAPALTGFDVVVSDTITVAGGWAAELAGLPWIELSPHPLYQPSRGLPPVGLGLAAGHGPRGRSRDAMLRALSAPAVRRGQRQRREARASIGLAGPGTPAAHFVATLPALEPRRPDWPRAAHLIGPLHFEPTARVLTPPPGAEPLVVVAPSTAATGNGEVVAGAEAAVALLAERLPVRVAVSSLARPGRQDVLLRQARVTVCGGGHGLLSKSLLAGVPVVVVPGGGDQRELAGRVARLGCGAVVAPRAGEPFAGRLAAAIEEVVRDPGYAAAARRVGASVAGVTDPVRQCRVLVERMVPMERMGSCG